jgi:hypothetical protein
MDRDVLVLQRTLGWMLVRKGGALGVLSVLVFVVAEWTQWRWKEA